MKSNNTRAVLRRFLSYFTRHRWLFVLDMVCALLVAAIDLAFPLASRRILNTLLPMEQYRIFFAAIGLIIAAFLLRTVLNFIVTYWGHIFGIRVEADIRADLFKKLQKLGFDFYDKSRTGQLMSRMTTDLFDVTELAHHGPENLLIALITIGGALIAMFCIAWQLALVVAVVLPVFLLIIFVERDRMRRSSAEVKQETAGINAGIESSLSGIRTSRAFANEAVETEKFDEGNRRYVRAKGHYYVSMSRFMTSMEGLTSVMSVIIIGAGGYFIMQGKMTLVDLVAFNLYVTAFLNPVRKLTMLSELFVSGLAGLRRFDEIMQLEPSIQDAPDAAVLCGVQGDICVRNVDFSYDHEKPVLKNLSFHAAPGQSLAIVGASGCGKSTLCQLILRFYDVTGGSIQIDGQNIRRLTQQSLRENIGIVQQDVFLFADTILENIRYGRPNATVEEVMEAAKRAEVYDDILQMPNGFETNVGERGVRLSGGQKQRISIARMFLKNPKILILDEATSALDTLTEAKIQRALQALSEGRTTLTIAHRLSTIRNASRILVIHNGTVAEAGTHQELLTQNGLYATLYRMQNMPE